MAYLVQNKLRGQVPGWSKSLGKKTRMLKLGAVRIAPGRQLSVSDDLFHSQYNVLQYEADRGTVEVWEVQEACVRRRVLPPAVLEAPTEPPPGLPAGDEADLECPTTSEAPQEVFEGALEVSAAGFLPRADLEGMSRKDLLDLADAVGARVTTKMTKKSDVIAAIEAATGVGL